MNPIIWEYIGFIVAALILIWAVIELSKRFNRLTTLPRRRPQSWTTFETRPINPKAEALLRADSDESVSASDHEPLSRARQNGHYALPGSTISSDE